MKRLIFVLPILFFPYFSSGTTRLWVKENILKLADSIKTFVVDDFPVTNKMFEESRNREDSSSSYRIKNGPVFSEDKVWFTNKEINQTLVFELYTDYYRTITYCFLNNDIPDDIIRTMELYVSTNKFDTVFDSASFQLKKKYFDGFIKTSKFIKQSYFTSNKGFRLGDSKTKALKIYNKPDKIRKENGIEKLEWDFIGDNDLLVHLATKEKIDLKGKPVAKDSFGHKIIMYFRENRLIGLIILNEIP